MAGHHHWNDEECAGCWKEVCDGRLCRGRVEQRRRRWKAIKGGQAVEGDVVARLEAPQIPIRGCKQRIETDGQKGEGEFHGAKVCHNNPSSQPKGLILVVKRPLFFPRVVEKREEFAVTEFFQFFL